MEFDEKNYDKSMHKNCSECGRVFYKRKRDSKSQWQSKECCSMLCKNKRFGRLRKASVNERFFRFVDFAGEDECWNWKGSTWLGYGQINSGTGKTLKAYRVSYEMFKGEIPKELVVRHKCDNPSCVNPNHLELGTQKDNMKDASERGRLNPLSILNLRPGTKGMYGAGKYSNLELGRNVK